MNLIRKNEINFQSGNRLEIRDNDPIRAPNHIFIASVCTLVLIEIGYRIYTRGRLPSSLIMFVGTFILTIACIWMDLKKNNARLESIRPVLKVVHAADGLIALLLSIAMWAESDWATLFCLICLNKFFLLHLLSRMVTGVAAFSRSQIVLQTTKSFLHHNGSFLFCYCCSDPRVILLTGIWRFISMNAHAILAFREHLNIATYRRTLLLIAWMRNIMMVIIIALLTSSGSIATGLRQSAMGHLAYLAVRYESILFLGGGDGFSSIYMTGDDNQKWLTMTTSEKMFTLMKGKHKLLGSELLLMTIIMATMVFGRLSTELVC